VRVGGQVQGARLPGLSGVREEAFQTGGVHRERGHPVGLHVVLVTGQAAVGVVGDDDLRADVAEVRDQVPHRLVQRGVAPARSARGALHP
jgi:hypothetical protein